MKLDHIVFKRNDDSELHLYTAEAQELYRQLHKLFGEKVWIEPSIIPSKVPPFSYPLQAPSPHCSPKVETDEKILNGTNTETESCGLSDYTCECGGTPFNTLSCVNCVENQEKFQKETK